jgi:Ca-activated chloride channel family protein
MVVLAVLALAIAGSDMASAGGAAGGRLSGKVTDTSGKTISGATITVDGKGFSGVSAANGTYSISGVPVGTWSVTCSAPNHVAQVKRNIKVAEGATTTVDFALAAAVTKVAEDKKKDEAEKKPVVSRPKKEMALADCAMPAAAPAERMPGYMGPPVQTVTGGEGFVEHNTEEYDRIYENTFLAALDNPLSTFSIDVDTASYANVRRFLNSSQMPPKDAVRIEELINYFDYDYPDPTGNTPFSIVTEISDCPWNEGHRLVHVGLQGKRMDVSKLPPSNLVFLLDVSGSMESPNKLPLLKAAFKLLVQNLRKEDRVAIVVYAGAAGMVLPSTSGADRDTILAALDSLQAGGSTAGGAGIQLAYKVAKENFAKGGNNRVILATDGDFNVGASSDGELVRMIEERRNDGIFLTILGFGMGNYKDSKMEKLADKGNGNYGYIDSILEAKKVLVSEMGGTLFTIAKDVKIQVEFNPARVKGYRLIGYENRMLKKEDFDDDKKDAGEMGAGHSVTALYEIIPADSKEEIPGSGALKYQKTKLSSEANDSEELLTIKLRYKLPDSDTSKLIEVPLIDRGVALDKASEDFRFSAAVAQYGLLLRDSEFKADSSYESVLALAKKAIGEDSEGYRSDFVKMVKQTQLLDSNQK